MPKSGLSGSVRGAPSNGRPYRDTQKWPRKCVALKAEPPTGGRRLHGGAEI